MITRKSASIAYLAATTLSSSTWGFAPTGRHCSNLETHQRRRTPNGISVAKFGTRRQSQLYSTFDDAEEEDDDEDEYIEIDSLGDWRNFRRSLTLGAEEEEESNDESNTRVSLKNSNDDDDDKPPASSSKKTTKKATIKSVSKDNEEVLRSQNKDLAKEYMTGVWAHETSTVSHFGSAEICGRMNVYWDAHAFFQTA